MSKNRSLGIWILIVVFAYSAADGFDTLTQLDGTPDYRLFAQQGVGVIFLLLVSTIVALDVASLWVLFQPRPIGYRIVLLDLGLSLVAGIVTGILALAHPEVVREVLAASSARGGPPLEADLLTSPAVMMVQLAVFFAFSALFIAVAVRKRAYFLDAPQETRTAPPTES